LPKAVPALLRHLAAYGELVALDVARAQREIGAIMLASAVAVFALLFALILSCAGIIAYFWDTPHRVAAIAWLAGGFLGVAVIALWYRASSIKARSPFLADMRREWQEDRVILERFLSGDEEPQ
jgi:uncharacterized membrane protein YqjE